jgi:para-nitrobenzyl esterase
VPLVIGANSLETPIPPGGRAPAMEALMNTFVTLEERPALVPAYGDEATLLEHLPSDFSFTATMRSLAKFHMAQAPTYMYRFSAVSASVADKFKGAAHATERMYVFNTLSASNWATAERDQKLATAMSAYWVAFARTHNPNGDAQSAGVRAAWPRYDGIHIIDFTNDGPVPQEDPWNARLDALAKFTDPRS